MVYAFDWVQMNCGCTPGSFTLVMLVPIVVVVIGGVRDCCTSLFQYTASTHFVQVATSAQQCCFLLVVISFEVFLCHDWYVMMAFICS